MRKLTDMERRKIFTHKTMVKIAEARIKAFNLKDTPEQFIAKSMALDKEKQNNVYLKEC